jgi:hypothetical protein
MLLRWQSSSSSCRCRASARPFCFPSQNCHTACPACPEARREERREKRRERSEGSSFPSDLCASVFSSPTLSPSTFNFQRSFRESPYQYQSTAFTLPLFSYCYALFCTVKNVISNRFIPFHALSAKHPGWGYPMIALSAQLFSPFSGYPAPNPFRIRTSAKHARNSCEIRTSKTQDLKSFRIRISGKTPGGPPPMPKQSSRHSCLCAFRDPISPTQSNGPVGVRSIPFFQSP